MAEKTTALEMSAFFVICLFVLAIMFAGKMYFESDDLPPSESMSDILLPVEKTTEEKILDELMDMNQNIREIKAKLEVGNQIHQLQLKNDIDNSDTKFFFPDDITVPYSWFTPEHETLLRAIATVESGNDPRAVGDNGAAIGIYQIHRAFWIDSGLDGSYEDCYDQDYARKVVLAYWNRYGNRVDYTLEGLSRLHNGGCGIMSKQGTRAWDNTTAYWNKVKNHL